MNILAELTKLRICGRIFCGLCQETKNALWKMFKRSFDILIILMFKREAIIVCSHIFVYDQNSTISFLPPCLLKALDTFNNCQRPVFTLKIMHKITNLYKFGLNWSSKLGENNGRNKHPCRTSCVLLDALNLRPQMRSRIQFKYVSEILLLSQIRYFRGSSFSMFYTVNNSLLLDTK